jgi:aminomethyltransferase
MTQPSSDLLATPLHDEHVALGGKLVPFAGWSMPVQYAAGIQAEHRAVREAAGLFDVSHMGEFALSGPDALELVLELAVNDASRLEVGQAQYSALCTPEGTVRDDLLVYRTGEEAYLLVVNAANRQDDWDWIQEHVGGRELVLEDRSTQTGLLALQGPAAEAMLQPLVTTSTGGDLDLGELGYYRFVQGHVAGIPTLVARTGYTGEDGFELYLPWDATGAAWRALLDAGTPHGLLPAGLGARDSLRLEVGYPLYGQDLDREHTALESGLGWIVKFDRGPGVSPDFIGREALARQKEEGVTRKLAGLVLTERGFPRPGHAIVSGGEPVGVVTSGTVSPSIGSGIALGWVPAALARPGTEVAVRIRDRDIPAVVQRPPFYTEGSIRR